MCFTKINKARFHSVMDSTQNKWRLWWQFSSTLNKLSQTRASKMTNGTCHQAHNITTNPLCKLGMEPTSWHSSDTTIPLHHSGNSWNTNVLDISFFFCLLIHQGIKKFQKISVEGVRKLCAASFISQDKADEIICDSNRFSDFGRLNFTYLGQ